MNDCPHSNAGSASGSVPLVYSSKLAWSLAGFWLVPNFDFPNHSWALLRVRTGQEDASVPVCLPWHIQQLIPRRRWPDAIFPLDFPLHPQPLF